MVTTIVSTQFHYFLRLDHYNWNNYEHHVFFCNNFIINIDETFLNANVMFLSYIKKITSNTN